MAVRCSDAASHHRTFGTKVAREDIERGLAFGRIWYHEGIVVAGYGEDRSRIVAERRVELIVIILQLAKIVDDIAKMHQERWPVRRLRYVAVHGELVGDCEFVAILLAVRGRAGIPNRVKNNSSGLLDFIHDVRASRAERLRERVEFV